MAKSAEPGKVLPRLIQGGGGARTAAGKKRNAPAADAATRGLQLVDTHGAVRATRTRMETIMDQASKSAESFFKVAEEAAEFGRGNVEAITRATQVYMAGVQDLGRQTFAMVQGLTDHALEGAKALSGVKSLQEAAQIQANYTRAAIEKSVNEGAKIGESALKLSEQAFAPLTARVTLAVEKFGRPIAA